MKYCRVDLNKLTMEGLKAYFQLLKEGAEELDPSDYKPELRKMEEIEEIPEPPEYKDD